jgi:hypothetical protein
VVHADEADLLDGRADFFHAFAGCRIPRILVVVDEPAGKAPLPVARLNRAAAEKYPAVDIDHNRCGNLRVMPQHEIVVGARLDLAAFDHTRYQLGAAIDAVVAHPANFTDPRKRLKLG